jgi:hypothetical protein
MWKCPTCKRSFLSTNQSHYCVTTTIDDIFAGKADNVVHAFDDLLLAVMEWEPQEVGAAKKAVVFTSKRAWLIVRPMSKQLDVSFYTDELLQSPLLFKSAPWMKGNTKHRNSLRLSGPGELTTEHMKLLEKGWKFGLR